MIYCRVHRVMTDAEGLCPKCEELGMRVISCEIDKIDRVYTTMREQDYEMSYHSYAVLIFERGDAVHTERIL